MNAKQRRAIRRKYPSLPVYPLQPGEMRCTQIVLKDKNGTVVYKGQGVVTMLNNGKVVRI